MQRQLDAFFQLSPQHVRVGSYSAFQLLLSESNTMHKSFKKVQHVMHLQRSQEVERRDWKLQQNPEHGTFIEMVARYVVPFDKTRVGKALRNLYTQRSGKLHLCEV